MMTEVLAQASERPSARVPIKVLLVDDQMQDLLYYTAILQRLNYDVRPFASYTEAASLFQRENFDLVIVSQGGKSFEGRQVLARAIEADRQSRVLVLTPLPDMACYVQAMQMGAADYVQKPVNPSELAELVHRHLRAPEPRRRSSHLAPRQGEMPLGRASNS